ncbi:MAG: hypothetical protein KatS3mg011_0997 [Acidimicrobiia bacterium]|nr:MAG: hypothetical protein KatS3mg011_0997 [Acidimicrobiia bacterium]
MLLWAVRQAEPWTPGSILAGLVLAAGLVALVVWAMLRSSRE